jgi:hypothetical protein
VPRRVTFEAWKKRVEAYAGRHLGADDLFNASDPYDIKTTFDPKAAYDSGQKPSAYVREVFEEDFAAQANDRDLARGG